MSLFILEGRVTFMTKLILTCYSSNKSNIVLVTCYSSDKSNIVLVSHVFLYWQR